LQQFKETLICYNISIDAEDLFYFYYYAPVVDVQYAKDLGG
jgi:hypothetical protein